MTLQEKAIEQLERISEHLSSIGETEDYTDMAIKALETASCIKEKCAYCPHCEHCDVDDDTLAIKTLEQQPCEDAISRQAVINAIANTCFWLSADNWEELIKCINSISPVTPAEKQQPCEDCISREEALKAMCDKCPMYNCVTGCSSYRHIEKMPSVTPQPKKGKWIEQNDTSKHHYGWYYCSECGAYIMSKCNYCSECGSYNGGEKDV